MARHDDTDGQRVGAQATPATAAPGRRAPVPERSADFAHLTLAALRAYRKTLAHEESRVSYWRRLIQARLDVLRDDDGRTPQPVDRDKVERLRGVLAEARPVARQALVSDRADRRHPAAARPRGAVVPQVDPEDPAHSATLLRELAFAELQLSAYRTALHARLGAATRELIARYREDPLLCLTRSAALPTGASSLPDVRH